MVLFKKIVEKDSVNNQKKGENAGFQVPPACCRQGFQVPGSKANPQNIFLQIKSEIPKYKTFEVRIWHPEQGTWHFFGKVLNLQYLKTEPKSLTGRNIFTNPCQ